MAVSDIVIRVADPARDAAALADIYRPYVEGTTITFEYEAPSAEEFAARMRRTLERYPYLVACDGDDSGRPLGYAYAGPFKGRAAYDWAVETSIYVAQDARGRHVGSRLLDELERLVALQGITNVEACITYPDEGGSVGFHERRGYRLVGTFEKCGFKLGRWCDMLWMEHIVAEHPAEPRPLVPFPELQL